MPTQTSAVPDGGERPMGCSCPQSEMQRNHSPFVCALCWHCCVCQMPLLAGSMHVSWALNVTPLMWTNDSNFSMQSTVRENFPRGTFLPSKKQLQKYDTEQRPSIDPTLGITRVTRIYFPQRKKQFIAKPFLVRIDKCFCYLCLKKKV